MKQYFSIATASVLLLGAAFLYSCQKEAPVSQPTEQSNTVSVDRAGVCNSISIVRAQGMFICGTDSGNSQCTTCGQNKMGEIVASNTEVYGFTGSNSFSLTNFTGNPKIVGLAFNCALSSPMWVTIPANSTVGFTVAPNAQGCCEFVIC